MTTLVQAINLPNLYVNGMNLSWIPAKEASISAGQIRNNENTFDITFDNTVTIDATKNGAGGLDTGTIAADKWYRVYVIYQKTKYSLPSAMVSNFDIPIIPIGYDDYIRIGWLRTNGSANFEMGYQTGNGNARIYQWKNAINVLSGGTDTSFTAVDLDAAVPPVDKMPIVFRTALVPNSAGNYIEITPDSSATIGAILSGSAATVEKKGALHSLCNLVSGKANIYYKVGNASDSGSLNVWQFVDFI